MNNNLLEFMVKMKDLMSGGLAKLASNAKASFSSIQSGIDKTVRRNDELASSFDKVSKRAQSSGNSISGFGRSLTAYIGVAAALGFGGGAIKSAMDYGMQKESLAVLAGDRGKGESLSSGLNKMQQDTILGPEVFKNAQTMMGFGIGVDKVIPTLKMLGDVSMGNADKLAGLTLAYSQVSAAGKLTGNDLMQFINAGFNPLNEISKRTGKSLGEVKEIMSKGGISAQMVTQAFIDATSEGGLFNGMLDKLAGTAFGKFQKLMGGFEALKIKVGETLLPIATTFMNVADFLLEHIEIVGAVVAMWGTYSVVTKTATFYQHMLNGAMKANLIYLAISLIVGLVAWIAVLGERYKLWGENLNALSEVIKSFGNRAWIPFKMFGETAWYHVQKLWLNIKDFAEGVTQTFGKVGAAWELAKQGQFGAAKQALGTTMQTEASKQLGLLELAHASTQKGLANDFIQSEVSFVKNWSKIKATGAGGSSVSALDISGGKKGPSLPPGGDKPATVASGIAGSGPRTVHVSIGKMVETINIHANSVKDGVNGIEAQVKDVFLRLLNSGAAI